MPPTMITTIALSLHISHSKNNLDTVDQIHTERIHSSQKHYNEMIPKYIEGHRRYMTLMM